MKSIFSTSCAEEKELRCQTDKLLSLSISSIPQEKYMAAATPAAEVERKQPRRLMKTAKKIRKKIGAAYKAVRKAMVSFSFIQSSHDTSIQG